MRIQQALGLARAPVAIVFRYASRMAIPGVHRAAVAARVEEIAAVNRSMEQCYRGRQQQFPIV